MSISSSMNAGLSGLNANANKLATISDNIANSQTYGYKRADMDFASMTINENVRTYTAGGVRTTGIRDVEAKGAFVGTNNSTDIAIAGRGMLPVTSITAVNGGETNLPLMLTSTGSFQPDVNGVLRTPSGLVLMGWPADLNGIVPEPPRDTPIALRPVVINRAAVAAEPTSLITLSANLPASATQPLPGGFDDTVVYPITVEYFDNLGASQTMSFEFRPVSDGAAPTPQPIPNVWRLTITDNQTGDVQGTFNILFDSSAGSGGSIAQVRPWDVAFDAPGPALPAIVPAPPAIPGTTAYNASTGEFAMTLGPVGAEQEVRVQLGAEGSAAPQFLSQLSSIFSPVGVTKNGSPAGNFTGVTIDENGLLYANYSSGFSRVIYKVPVADVPNMNGLRALDNQAFAISSTSGSVYFWDAGTGPVGDILGFAREQSTTDIGNELTQLIQTQRAYSSNAKIIQTVDEMLQETTNLKR
jgi:flagellar hook protein FlgE